MHLATMIVLILAAGLGSQWLASRLKLPAIVVLIAAGITLGPVTGLIHLEIAQAELTELIGLGVAIILFEGAMDLRLGEFKRAGNGIRRLTLIGPPVAWGLGTLAAHYIAGLSWPVSWVLGAILVVTGPTVILPLLRQTRLNKTSSSLLKWEGIVNDPVGVLLAVLAFQYFTHAGEGIAGTLASLGAAVAVAAVLGGVGGWVTVRLFRRGAVPSHIKAPLLMVFVLVVYWASNQVQHEAGLLSVTVMGIVVGNMKLAERERLLRFKEHLTVILLSMLFIIIPSQLNSDQLTLIDWRIAGFVAALLFVVRPLSIAIAVFKAPMRRRDKLLLAWIAPRGIVAAATAGIFGPALVLAGYPDAEKLLPTVFLVIIVTVLAHGLTIGLFARYMSLAADAKNGLLIVGGTAFTHALATVLTKLNVDVLVASGAYDRLRPFRHDGIPVYYGEILSEHADHELHAEHLSYLLCATENDYYNALVCQAQGAHFGQHRTLQLPTHQEAQQEHKRLQVERRGYFAFDEEAHYRTLDERLAEGWGMRTTRLTKDFTRDQFLDSSGTQGEHWVFIGAVSPSGELRVFSHEHGFVMQEGWTLVYFAPPNVKKT